MNELLSAARSLAPALRELQAALHQCPEASMAEHKTSALLRQRLQPLPLTLVDTGLAVGVVCVLSGARPGPLVALRADIDAVAGPAGPAHLCGHDFHAACLWGAARLLADRREKLAGSVAFLFQPAEETLTGAAALLSHGLWERLAQRPRLLFGLHNRPELPTGRVAVVAGPLMAGKTDFSVTLRGRTGHGGSPHKCVDVIVAGVALVSAIQTVVSRNADPRSALVCAVCSIHSGTPENFTPEELVLTGSIRALKPSTLSMAETRVRQLSQELAAAYGCAVTVNLTSKVPVLHNGPEETAVARRAAEQVFGADAMDCPPPDLGAEDFAVYGQTVPSFFYWLGTGTGQQETPGWHSASFRTDDDALPLGAALLAQSALEVLG